MSKEEKNVDVEEERVPNEELYEQLTSKSKDYIFDLNRTLTNYGMDEEDREDRLNTMMETLIEEQPRGVTARQLYGTVRDQARYLAADYVSTKTDEAVKTNQELSEDWKLWLDGGLLMGGIYSVITGIGYFITETPEEVQLGWFTLLMTYVLGGVAMMFISKNVPREGQKGGFIRYFLVSLASIFVWVVIMALITVFLPPSFNVPIPGWALLIIGIVTLVARWYLKKKLNIVSNLF